ncbi:hypothetical protein NDU88_008522 [Pleurodeles waltl]|uniref:Uncharacterized protein n=1 Tax=Pleurodeles waltl TaxID=8319 RepID=A0AAV7QSR6_PLEWA|nr:hypothetical protein NDU88_008522 [Pleurodeles waltl]
MSPHTQSAQMTDPQVSTAPVGSALAPDGSGLDRSVSPSPGARLSVLKPVSSTSANFMSMPRDPRKEETTDKFPGGTISEAETCTKPQREEKPPQPKLEKAEDLPRSNRRCLRPSGSALTGDREMRKNEAGLGNRDVRGYSHCGTTTPSSWRDMAAQGTMILQGGNVLS